MTPANDTPDADALDALRDALAKTTQGKWFIFHRMYPNDVLVGGGRDSASLVIAQCNTTDDAEFVALAHDVIPEVLAQLDAALDALRAAEAERDAMKAQHAAYVDLTDKVYDDNARMTEQLYDTTSSLDLIKRVSEKLANERERLLSVLVNEGYDVAAILTPPDTNGSDAR